MFVPLKPFTFKASVVLVGVVRPVVIPKVPAVPDRFTVVKAFDEIVELPKLFKVTLEIVAALVALPALTSAIVTVPFVIPITPTVALLTAATAADWVTETLVVSAVPVTLTFPITSVAETEPVFTVNAAAAVGAAVALIVTVVPPVTVIALLAGLVPLVTFAKVDA